MRKRILTYGTFDLLHVGHIRLLRRLATLGDELIVGVSTDDFNEAKGKKSVYCFDDRAEIVSSLRFVSKVIPEISWDQKVGDIGRFEISIFAMGSDWEGKFDYLRDYCEVKYLPRTDGISSSKIKSHLNDTSLDQIELLHESIEVLASIKKNMQ